LFTAVALATALSIGSGSGTVTAAPGELDRTFASDGVAELNIASRSEAFDGVAVDGNAPAACGRSDNDVLVAKFRRGGAPNHTFSGNGWTTLDFAGRLDSAYACAFLADGRIAAAGSVTMRRGSSRFSVFVFKLNGAPDPKFSGDGVATVAFPDGYPSAAYHLVVQPNGKIVAVGESFQSGTPSFGNFVAVRLRSNGSLDDTFSGDGRIHVGFGAGDDGAWRVRLQRDGKLVMAGWTWDRADHLWNTAVVRLRRDGVLDDTFAGDGKAIYDLVPGGDDWSYGLDVRRTGQIVIGVVNDTMRKPIVLQVTATGKRDRVFGRGDGVARSLGSGFYLQDLVLQDDGKIIIVGEDDSAADPAAIRLTRRGLRDDAFDDDGRSVISRPTFVSVGAAAVDAKGRLLIAGSSSVAELMRLRT
jgi:uncharacterized delta-60 repeat protein